MTLLESVAERVPEDAKPRIDRLAHFVVPWMSWRKRRRVHRTEEAFVDRFFPSPADFEAYEQEFFAGRIVDICRSAAEELSTDGSIYDAHMDECARLYALVREYEPTTIVETGVYHGVSTASLLLALDENDAGTLYSLDPVPLLQGTPQDAEAPALADGRGATIAQPRRDYYERGRPSCSEAGTHRIPEDREAGWIVPDDLHDHWDRRTGRSQRDLPGLLDSVGGVDLFIQDSEHSQTGMAFEFDLAWEHLVPGGLLVSFHVDWNDAFDAFVEERGCAHGPLAYTYNGFEDYETACTSAYAIKPARRRPKPFAELDP
ncbi:hypothetical protein L593_00420 [Salinarchaeum sp. Harcht-Bsk1]|uniref:class I SAM-dependent methyltransferase n=1 Tax=Salinarchaeum sp. Harcht-Bsk1 TaxID=1333523 RepID=UPI00034248F0|nr:class I SAM-dependent methyltransferase [Salinarchaeum sp. Harcht-Bsk1]AGN00039.1 hypothetical protein L593_00420 [Salinarchaeum sp. Harcht-Bsk1]